MIFHLSFLVLLFSNTLAKGALQRGSSSKKTRSPSWTVPTATGKKTKNAPEPTIDMVITRIHDIRNALSQIGTCTKDQDGAINDCKEGKLAELWKTIQNIDPSTATARYEEGKKGKMIVTQPYATVQNQISSAISAPDPKKPRGRHKNQPPAEKPISLEGIRKTMADYKNEILYFERLFNHSPEHAEKLKKALQGDNGELELNALLDKIASTVGTFHSSNHEYEDTLYDVIDKKIKELLKIKKTSTP